MPTILLTGFEAFGGSHSNPSQQVAEALHGERIDGAQVVSLILPVAYAEATDLLTKAIADHKPTLVLSLGLAAGASCLQVERFAVNLHVTEPGDPNRPRESNASQSVIVADGMAALFSTIDAERIAAVCREMGIPAKAHGYAGAYLCNFVFYQALNCALQWDLRYCAGFIHLPFTSEQVIAENKMHQPSLSLKQMTTGVRAAIATALPGIC